MPSYSDSESAALGQLATYLSTRRDTLLNNWRTACETNPALKGARKLSREEFNNKTPFMLNVLQQQLRGQHEEAQVDLLATEHGLHRWQKGYTLSELSAEMQCLGRLLLSELRIFWQDSPSTDCMVMTRAYEHLATFSNQISTGSVGQYADLQRSEAFSRVKVLEKALSELNEVGHQRSELLRYSSHDLRGSFGAIQGAATLLELVMDSQEERNQLLNMLKRNLSNCSSLLTQLMDLARLEAGQEVLNVRSVDVGQLLTNLVAGYQPLADERGLLLKADGPVNLSVECDPIHLQRIIQNLVLNALKHTSKGWISVSWTRENEDWWIINVQDSGPGLPNTAASSLPEVLTSTTESTAVFEGHKLQANTQETASIQASSPVFRYKGEGIGLSIVKKLCELLRANLEIKSKSGEGTLFRLRLAVHW